MRGKLPPTGAAGFKNRLIPAGAGKTTHIRHCAAGLSAHPRRCGENLIDKQIEETNDGSSPQVRGKLREREAQNATVRLIPAGAAKTVPTTFLRVSHAAHPRRCGENLLVGDEGDVFAGSSPQVRGKRMRWCRSPESSRLIPAGAGKTGITEALVTGSAAHPRRCGENWRICVNRGASCGSSPQVRGKRPVHRRHGRVPRLIPAGAGKTTRPSQCCASPSAHPRRCGEN